jgi:hypothetical protein
MTDTTMLTRSAKSFFLRALCFTSLALLGGACTKEDTQPDPEPVPAGNERLLIASTFLPGIKAVEYNADKMPKRYETDASEVVDITYTPDSVVYTFKRKTLDGRRVYKLEKGIVTSSTGYTIDKKGDVTGSSTVTYFYKNGKVEKEVGSVNGEIHGYVEYRYENENLVEMTIFGNDGKPESKSTYEYTDIPDKSGPARIYETLFPKKSKYLVKKATSEDFLNHAKVVTTYAYELDEQGYVITGKEISEGSEYKWTNTWQ